MENFEKEGQRKRKRENVLEYVGMFLKVVFKN